MKPILFSIIFLFIAKPAFSQSSTDDKTILLDSTFVETDIKNYVYHRIVKDYKKKQANYFVYDYYKSGSILMKGASTSKDNLVREGQFVFYYENGNKKSVVNYSKNHPDGKELRWYENGNYKQEGDYIYDKKNNKTIYKINQFWNTDGLQKVTDGNGDYEEVGKKNLAFGKVKDGYKDGPWEGYDKNIGYTFNESYENGKLVSGVSIDTTKTTHNYTIVEKKPEPKDGIESFYRYIGQNFRKYNLPQGVNGRIITKFIVDKEGQIIEAKIQKSLGYGDADNEALRLVSKSEKWIPGEIRGIKVKCMYSLPITIKTNR